MADQTASEKEEHKGVSRPDQASRPGWPAAHLIQPCHIHHAQHQWVQQWDHEDLGGIAVPRWLGEIHIEEHHEMVDERGLGLFHFHSAGVRRPDSNLSQFCKLNANLTSFRTMTRLRWGSSMTTWYSQKTWICQLTPKICWRGECLHRWPSQVRVSPFWWFVALAKALDLSATVASTALSGAVSTNLLLSIVAGVSMKKLWTMISSLQIIVHYPMLKIAMPANLLKMLNAIVEIVNLGLVPKKYI